MALLTHRNKKETIQYQVINKYYLNRLKPFLAYSISHNFLLLSHSVAKANVFFSDNFFCIDHQAVCTMCSEEDFHLMM